MGLTDGTRLVFITNSFNKIRDLAGEIDNEFARI